MVDDSHEHLVRKALDGDGAALDGLLERHLPALLAYVRLHADPEIRRHESCADVAQSVCREVLGESDRFEYRGEPAFRKWLFTKAMAKLVDRKRFYLREKRDPGRELRLDASGAWSRLENVYASIATPSRAAMAREDVERFEAAFARLPEEQRHVITAARVLGQSHAEIAAELGKTEGAVRVLLHRALVRVGLWMAEAAGE